MTASHHRPPPPAAGADPGPGTPAEPGPPVGPTAPGDPTLGGASEKGALRPLWMQVYLPNLVLAAGQGAMLPVLVYAAHDLHATPGVATAVVAANAFGTMLFDLPAGRVVARLGENRSGWLGAALMAAGLVGCLLAGSVPVLAASLFVQAGGLALWSLARLTHLSRVAPPAVRGRALSLFGGVMRAGNVIGPFVFVAVAARNDAAAAFAVYLVAVLLALLWLVAARDRSDHEASAGRQETVRPLRVLHDHRRGFATSGVGAFGIMLLRGSRTAIVPLWAAHIGLGSSTAATIFAWTSLVDLALFYPAGVVSDRWGRRAVALPCIALLSVGHLLIPLSHSARGLFAVALLLGVGNGMGSGIVMTLGADLSPAVGRASFLSVWRLVSDAGNTTGPLVDSVVVAAASITFAGPVAGVLGLVAGVVLAVGLEEPGRRRASPASPAGPHGTGVG
ncbi:MAG TPA: MFS transporter [Acidimicrobiales bacterium]|nr:MFS transporter [Acidimicrobiales bacterium]